MSRPWMPFYVGDYLKDTGNLGALEHGAYLLLILHYWQHGGLPSDEDELSAIARLTEPQWQKARQRLSRFFYDGWKHKRVEKELQKADEKYLKRAEAGKKGGNATAAAKQMASKQPSNAGSMASSNAPAKSHQPHQEKNTSSETLVLSLRARVFKSLSEPIGFFEEGELNNIIVAFPETDHEAKLPGFWRWSERQGWDPERIKATYVKTLKNERGAGPMVAAKSNKADVVISAALANSPLVKKSRAQLTAELPDLPDGLDRRRQAL